MDRLSQQEHIVQGAESRKQSDSGGINREAVREDGMSEDRRKGNDASIDGRKEEVL